MPFKYTAYLPVYASAKFELITDEPISSDDLQGRFLAEAEPVGSSLCWQCSEGLETDFEVMESVVGEILIDETEEG